MKTMRIGSGAGYSGDRIEPAVELAEKGRLRYLCFECLAERTIARENLTRQKSPDCGYTPRLVERMQPVLAPCIKNGTRIVTNMGAANPEAAGREIGRVAKDAGLGPIKCAVVTGDDVAELVRQRPDLPIMQTGEPVETLLPRMVCVCWRRSGVQRSRGGRGPGTLVRCRMTRPSTLALLPTTAVGARRTLRRWRTSCRGGHA